MKYFDAHTHVNFVAYSDDREATIQRAKDAGVAMNVVGTQINTSTEAVALAERYDHVYATIGLHPIHTAKSYHDEKELGEGGTEFTSKGEIFDTAKYEALGQSSRVVAIGECGLDYYRVEESTKEVQIKAFVEQIELANKLQKPLMLHIRNAYDDALEVVKNTPLDMILSETDAPYITPVPHRGKRNESSFVPFIVEKIASIRGEDAEKVREQLFQNACRVFQISGI